MRVIVYGVGAVGGTIAAGLARAGVDVIGIARGAQLEAIRANGLRLRTPKETFTQMFACVASPAEIAFRPDDAILLTMKTQDTEAALTDLLVAGVDGQPIFCFQNGVTNEHLALRRFACVHGATVMLPATFLTPGEVIVNAEPKLGLFDIGRFPGGITAEAQRLCAVLNAADFAAFACANVMESKFGKLLLNLGNIIEAAVGPGVDASAIRTRVRAEAEKVLHAAGVSWREVGQGDPRRAALLRIADVKDAPRSGGSTTQSLKRGAGRVETDYLNGEISYLARMHGAPSPLNDRLTRLAAKFAAQSTKPGSMAPDELSEYLRL